MTATTFAIGLALAGAAAFGLSLALTLLAERVARRIGFVDRPGGPNSHKSHREPIPYGGGAAIFLSAWLVMGVGLAAAQLAPDDWIIARFGETARHLVGGVRNHMVQAVVILAGGLVLFVLGLIDDRRPLGPWTKLLAIAAAAAGVAGFGNVRIVEFAHPAISIALTVVWIITITNALNFLDNMDGLSAGVAVVCTAFLLCCGVLAAQKIVPVFAVVLLGATLGFLVRNFPPARIFMGDAGSLVLGYLLAVLAVLTSYWESGEGKPAFALASPLAVLAVPLYDFASVVISRLLEGRNPLKGDQRHFSHRLVERGLSRRSAVLTIYLAAATTGLAATLLPGADLRQTLSILVIVVMTLAVIAILEAPLRKDGE
ncbi:MAG: undecaprenyl/decaprenyl-phosphate alpha-N-acetylglucosaminyl 1-phosphate transferase [Planctomycetes bacterium]|nr:undecaprenyl/decaprenyl-phosphate alpha-N-acetylglucosaminyl 1-phosphate transferase [Planctomycetota bacterium]